jgi:protein subunit release factor A
LSRKIDKKEQKRAKKRAKKKRKKSKKSKKRAKKGKKMTKTYPFPFRQPRISDFNFPHALAVIKMAQFSTFSAIFGSFEPL